MRTWLRLLVCTVTAATLSGSTQLVGGAADLPATQTPGPMLPVGVDVEHVMLDTRQMRGITGAGEHLTIIPTTDVKSPVDIDPLADTVPARCRCGYAETATFGTETTRFHKTTFQAEASTKAPRPKPRRGGVGPRRSWPRSRPRLNESAAAETAAGWSRPAPR